MFAAELRKAAKTVKWVRLPYALRMLFNGESKPRSILEIAISEVNAMGNHR
jgi:hypothetical protein